MGARYEDTLLASLREKDELIVVLKRALHEKTKRLSGLEQIINLLGASVQIETHTDDRKIGRIAPASPCQDIQRSSTGSDRHSDEILLLEASSGIYPDNWLKSKSSLAIIDSCAGAAIFFAFYLPEFPGWISKMMIVKPNFSDAAEIEIPRGRAVTYRCEIPKELAFTPRLNLEVVEEPRNENDLRDLGVLLISAKLNGQAVA